jgi:iron-sulfur cluster assembly 1
MKDPIQITPAACEHIMHILSAHDDQVLILGVNNKGCSGHSYTFELKSEQDLQKWDVPIVVGDHKVVIEAASLLKLIGSTLDYESDAFGSRFVWHNPAVKHTCGCGESVGF